jgi:hypothetical protein
MRLLVRMMVVGGMLVMPALGFGAERQAEGKAVAVAQGTAVTDQQKELAADMEKLVRLSAALKVSVDKSTKDQLSTDVLRKADEVERLARSLRVRVQEMK